MHSTRTIETTAATTRPRRAKANKPSATVAVPSRSTTATASSKKRAATSSTDQPPAKRGRPSKAQKPAEAAAVTPTQPPSAPNISREPPRKRGQPPKGGETTRDSRDDVAAAEQLEEELIEAVDEHEVTPTASLAKSEIAVKGARGKTSNPRISPQDSKHAADTANEGDDGAKPRAASEKRYFLMKAEQEDRFETLKSGRLFNTKFTIDDLREKTAPEMWDGVRNFVARNVMREMKNGDLAFFYASGGKGKRKPGIVGTMEVVREAEPDPTTADEDAIGFVEKEADRDKWVVVHVKFREKFENPVTLETLKEHGSSGGRLSGMHMLNGPRLSVSRIRPEEWDFIMNELVVQGKE